jgi:hypothetical protein
MFRLTMLSNLHKLYNEEWKGGGEWWIGKDVEGCADIYKGTVYMQGLKTVINISQHSQASEWKWNLGFPEYKTVSSTTKPQQLQNMKQPPMK